MLDLRRLRLLHDLSRLGTLAAVARTHSYTPSAVSQQLSALEREAGVALLERAGRRVTLTADGRVLARHAETVLAAVEGAEAALAAAAAADGPAGPLRIGAFPTAVRQSSWQNSDRSAQFIQNRDHNRACVFSISR